MDVNEGLCSRVPVVLGAPRFSGVFPHSLPPPSLAPPGERGSQQPDVAAWWKSTSSCGECNDIQVAGSAGHSLRVIESYFEGWPPTLNCNCWHGSTIFWRHCNAQTAKSGRCAMKLRCSKVKRPGPSSSPARWMKAPTGKMSQALAQRRRKEKKANEPDQPSEARPPSWKFMRSV